MKQFYQKGFRKIVCMSTHNDPLNTDNFELNRLLIHGNKWVGGWGPKRCRPDIWMVPCASYPKRIRISRLKINADNPRLRDKYMELTAKK